MRTAITVGRKHGGKKLEIISGPETPIREQLDAFKDEVRSGESHESLEYIELWISDSGRAKKRKFITPAAAKAKVEAEKKRQVDAVKAKADAEKQQAKPAPAKEAATATKPK
jgi:hypothetical protein